jgi:hypothetical protein
MKLKNQIFTDMCTVIGSRLSLEYGILADSILLVINPWPTELIL